MSTSPNHANKTISTTAGNICETESCPVRDLSVHDLTSQQVV